MHTVVKYHFVVRLTGRKKGSPLLCNFGLKKLDVFMIVIVAGVSM